MTKGLQWRLWMAIVAVFVSVPIDVVILRAMTQPTVAGRAHYWAASLSDEKRAEYLQRGGLPVAYFDALRKSLTPAGAARLFIDKMATYRRAHSRFSERQEEYLDRALELLKSGRLFGTGSPAVTQAESAALAREALTLFPDKEVYQALFTLTPPQQNQVGREPVLNRMAAYLLRLVPSSGLEAHYDSDDCGCNVGDDWCGGGSHCCGDSGCRESVPIPESTPANPTSCPVMCWQPGCGWYLAAPCNGSCVQPMRP